MKTMNYIFFLRWTFNPAVLTKVHQQGSVLSSPSSSGAAVSSVGNLSGSSGEPGYAIGDLVQVLSDVERVKTLQRGNKFGFYL